MKISGLTCTPTGKKFHAEIKSRFLGIALGSNNLEEMEKLDIDQRWLQDDGEGSPPNYDFLYAMKLKYFESFDKILEKGSILDKVSIRISRPAIERAWDLALACHRNDETYTERIGYLVNQVIKHEDDYRAGKDVFELVVEDFLKVEKRQDRLEQYNRIINWVRGIKKTSKFFTLSQQWICEYIYNRKHEWCMVVMDVKGQDMYDPINWGGNPGGRSDLWLLIHNGSG